jgi:L-lactate dehydrogenase (cytochrome)
MAPSWLSALRSVARFRKLELDPVARRLRGAVSVEDMRQIARRRLPRGVFDYIDGAAEDEVSAARNVDAFRSITFSPRVLNDVGVVDTTTSLLGRPLPLPLVLAPTGFTRMASSQGELAVARSAARAGLPYSLSTMSTRSIEEVAEVCAGPKWFQAYVWRDRGLLRSMLERALTNGYETLVITVDTAVLGHRERDVRRGFNMPPSLGLDTIIDGILHPAWTIDFLRAEPITFPSIALSTARTDAGDPLSMADFVTAQWDPSLSWDDIDWFREVWKGPIVLKGIQSVADAKRASAEGLEAIALSNHGGRQLDGAPAPADLIAPVRDAVGDSIEIICDGGVRRGSDIVKAIALGADACMIGRAYIYALAAGGERGVDQLLQQLDAGTRRTLALIGCPSIAALDRTYLEGPPGPVRSSSSGS